MSNVDDIKDRLKREPETIIIEEEDIKRDSDRESGSSSLVDEMGRFGRKLAENAQGALASDQADKLQEDLKRGWQKFSSEAGRVASEMRGDAQNAAEKIRSSRNEGDSSTAAPKQTSEGTAEGGRRINIPKPNITKPNINIDSDQAKDNMVKGLRWLSDEMSKLADRYQQNDDELSDQINIDP